MNPRRVVTGETADGRSVIVADERVEPITVALAPDSEFFTMWGADASLALPQDGAMPAFTAWFPPAGGFRFTYLTIPPERERPPPTNLAEALAEAATKMPGMLEALDPDVPGMHTTQTVDFVVVLEGRLWVELDDGLQTELMQGDCIVQNGTRHAWHNRSQIPCRIVAATIGVKRMRQS